ncbi:Serine/threonine-protein kinase 4 [Chytridiales sp. JEL 0842]|nr:Serine/threonine-protein kinase 4 [Chytridiales sp. JEL 0842]
MSEAQIAVICSHTLEGLSYLHSRRKIHRDIKAGNILVNSKGESKLADFGVAGQLSDNMAKRNTVIGTPFWMAPEVIQEVGYGVSADIWSLGITCIEMADGRPPYHNIHPMRAIFMIPTKPPPKLENESRYSPLFRDFVARCLTKDPKQRPTADQLLKDPFILSSMGVSVLTDVVADALDAIANGGLEWSRESDEEESESEPSDHDGTHVRQNQINVKAPSHSSQMDEDPDKTMKVRRSVVPRKNPSTFSDSGSVDDYESSVASLSLGGGRAENIMTSDSEMSSKLGDDEYGDDRDLYSDDNTTPTTSKPFYSDNSRDYDPYPPKKSTGYSKGYYNDEDYDDVSGVGTIRPSTFKVVQQAAAPERFSEKQMGGNTESSRYAKRSDMAPSTSFGASSKPNTKEEMQELLAALDANMDRELQACRLKYERKRAPIIEAILAKGGSVPPHLNTKMS